jgi:hypothetical protein
MYKKLQDVQDDLNQYRQLGAQRGVSIGWDFDLLPITLKPASTTYIGAAPHVGKTEFILELLINVSCLHGWKHCIFTPETGEPHEIFAELCVKYIGKDFLNSEHGMSEIERMEAEVFISEHFYIVDPKDEDLTIEGFYQLVDQIETDEGVKFDSTLIDPWNELTENYLPEDLGREDKYLSRILGLCRKNARKTGRHNVIINHVRDQAPQKLKNGTFYYPMPSPRDMAGGQVWFRKGMLMIMLWRPPLGWEDPTDQSVTTEENELVVKVAKSKPKGVSKNGLFKMYYDFKAKSYYIKDMAFNRYPDRGKHNKQSPVKKIEYVAEKLTLNEHINIDFDNENTKETPF